MIRLTASAGRFCAAVALSLTLGVAAAHAYAPPPDQEWAFDISSQSYPGNFDDGGLIQGGFATDVTTGALAGWNITTTTTSAFTGYNYTPTDSKLLADSVQNDGSVVIVLEQDTGPFGHVLADDAHQLTLVFGEDFPAAYPFGVNFMDAFTPPSECIGESCTTDVGKFRVQCDQCNQIGEVIVSPGDRFEGGPPPPTAAVPEPAAWALMILGFGGIGAALRRRRAMIPLTT